MSRRRVNRRQNPSRATSETVVNDGFSSDSESGRPVNVARRNRLSPIEENSSVRRESGTNSVDDAECRQQIPHDATPNDADTAPNDTRSQTPHRIQNLTEGSGDGPPQSRNFDTAQVNLLLQTFMTRMDQQSETHTRAIECMTHSMSMMRDTSGRQNEAHIRAISECISRSMSMMKDTCVSVKECVKVVTDSTQNKLSITSE